MALTDRFRWDERYHTRTVPPPGLPDVFAPFERLFPKTGVGLDLACGLGAVSVWLAARGLDVLAVDVSPVAIRRARELARREGIDCRFEVFDLDGGLPPGPDADVIFCHKFRDCRLDAAVIERLAPGGLLAISALSEVGAQPGPFRVSAGELPTAFAGLRQIAGGECGGEAWLLARRIEQRQSRCFHPR
ncbi:MAG: class I SAM-dependent methyltransferase [Mycobacterium sp.]|nr:class I SAM-dependent methyltransferase [Mycobacterium sp.]